MELESLVGLRTLTGVEMGVLPPDKDAYRYEDANTMAFILDGTTYVATEDPEDGYRSCMRDLNVCLPPTTLTNTFPPCQVLCRMQGSSYGEKNEILECIDIVTGQVVLEVGTSNTDDYYPSFVANFMPHNMAGNFSFSH